MLISIKIKIIEDRFSMISIMITKMIMIKIKIVKSITVITV